MKFFIRKNKKANFSHDDVLKEKYSQFFFWISNKFYWYQKRDPLG